MNQPIIEIKNLKKYFHVSEGVLHAVDDVSLTIARGETLGVVGESGCGKSTLGRTVINLLTPTEGQVLYNGRNIADFTKAEKRQACLDLEMIFQDPFSSLNPRMDVETLIAEPMIASGMYRNRREIAERVDKLMDTVGLASRLALSYPHELDGGRRQRIGVARALATNPKFIVCDEPVSALDVSIQAQILNLLMDLQDEMNLTYMFITHDMSVVKHISNNIAVMYLGQVVEYATSDSLFEHQYHPYTKALLSAIPEPTYEARLHKPHLIKGELTSPVDPKPGCRFASRCPYATDACRVGNIPMREVEKGHYVACHLENVK